MEPGGALVRAAFQGEAGAYSDGAAVSFFGGTGRVRTVPHQTLAAAVGSAEAGECDCAVIPVENSIEGSVGESNDLLRATALRAFGEAYHRIEHCLIGHGGVGDVRTVYSHPQALGQCRRFVERMGWRAVPAYDTAGSAMMVARMGPARRDAACIASRRAAEVHGVPVICAGIMDSGDNYTRFLVLGRAEGPGGGPGGALAGALGRAGAGSEGAAAEGTAASKTSIVFSVRDEPGALGRIVGAFGRRGINMTRIESRPTRSAAWEYNFFVDFEGRERDAGAGAALAEAREEALFLRVVGSYPAAQAPRGEGASGEAQAHPRTRADGAG